MVRLGQVVDGPVLRDLLHRLVAMATAAGVTRGRKMRVDTTVVEAPIHHPTDSGLCEDVTRVLSRAMRRLSQAGVELGFKVRNVRRSVSPVLPRPGHRTQERVAYERQRWFKRARAWRAGGEARISRLKNTFGMRRSRYRGRSGVDRCVAWAAIANNLVAIGKYCASDPSP